MRVRTLVSAAVVAASTIIPTVAVVSPSDAASTRTWQRLAMCESGGRWHIDTGNGYYGGLQISPGTWRGYGGRRFARLPSGASRAEQIRIAERIKGGQGWGAWPSCSARIGVR
jgi:hypothetical protein